MMRPLLFTAGIACLMGMQSAAKAATWTTLVDGSSLDNTVSFTRAWSYNYPWGDTHNGSAKMLPSDIALSNGVATVTSTPVSGQGKIHYYSGTFYLKQSVTIDAKQPKWDISVQAKVPTDTGTWPAFWLTGVKGWPPESDIMEFKGSPTVWQNTYNGKWSNFLTKVQAAGDWHTYRLVATMVDPTTVEFQYFVDDDMTGSVKQAGFVDAPLWVLFDYQMEGSSGDTGPAGTTYTYLRNPVVKYESGPIDNQAGQ